MTAEIDIISEVVHEATRPGEVAEPAELLAVIAASENPLTELANWDRANNLFDALHKEFSFIRNCRITKAPLQAGEQARWASLLRWLIRELQQWQLREDPRAAKLVAIFVVAEASDWDNRLWDLLPDEVETNPELVASLVNFINVYGVEFSARGGANVPIWEREAVEQFKQADAQGDWRVLGEKWPLFVRAFFGNALQTQAVRCLYRCSFNFLVSALANVHQTAVGMQVGAALAEDKRLKLSIASDNPYVQFGGIYQTVSDRQNTQPLSAETQKLMADLLLKVASDGPRWEAWMQVFNTYPVRYPVLQVALGRALAFAPEAAVEAYVNSIFMYAKPAKTDPCRKCVAECLRTFHATATAGRRRALWILAHKRWLDWNFDRGNENQHLFQVNCSDLDYAVVGYACECMDNAGRDNALEAIIGELRGLDHSWHPSITDMITSWNRLLSRFQPYAHASRANTGEDWLTESQTYLPEQATEEYRMMKYRVA